MKYREFGKTGLQVSEIGFGAWQIGGPSTLGGNQIGWGEVDDNVSKKVLNTAFEMGINFFDTADIYGSGHSETLIGEVFKGKRDKIIISSKGGNRENEKGEWFKDMSPEWTVRAVEASLKRLQTDYIDVYQLHSPPPGYEYTDDMVDAFEKLREQGKIRFYGVSLPQFGRDIRPSDQGMEILDTGRTCEFFQLIYNILQREAEEYLLPRCQREQVAVIARIPLASGFLSGKFTKATRFAENDVRHTLAPEKIAALVEKVDKLDFLTKDTNKTLAQAALQFCLVHPAVSTVIPGARNPEQVRQNAEACEKAPLTEEELKTLNELFPVSYQG
jgi:myo-inositol catabolism protein IolS